MHIRFMLIHVSVLFAVLCSEDEERLVRDLFRDYNKLIRPVESMNETVEVRYDLLFDLTDDEIKTDTRIKCYACSFGLNFIQLINVVCITDSCKTTYERLSLPHVSSICRTKRAKS